MDVTTDTPNRHPQSLASYACRADRSKGRIFSEDNSPTRSEFQRDRDRIVHSSAFRRLAYKTQVFVYHEGDHYRNRLTHSIEVSQIARALARAFRVDEDLAEALALSHDFGHTPFGHTGEDALDEVMRPYGGFDHNAQSLRIVTKLERRYAAFDGLNLSWETLEGLVKHNGPLIDENGGALHHPVPRSILNFNANFDLQLATHSSVEAQCAAIADDIAYNAHDLDDGLRSGLLSLESVSESLPMTAAFLDEIHREHPGLEETRIIHEITRRQITAMVEDVIGEGLSRIAALNPMSDQDVRNAGRPLVTFSKKMVHQEKTIKAYLFKHLYRAAPVMAVREKAADIIKAIFDEYFSGRAKLPREWGMSWDLAVVKLDEEKRARVVADFIAGMTDRYALLEYERLFDVKAELR